MCKKELPGSSADLVAYKERRSYCNNVKINATTGVCIKICICRAIFVSVCIYKFSVYLILRP